MSNLLCFLLVVLSIVTAIIENIVLQVALNCAAFRERRRRCIGQLLHSNTFPRNSVFIGRIQKNQRKHWVRPGRTSLLWDNFIKGAVVAEEWRRNFRMSKENFTKLSLESFSSSSAAFLFGAITLKRIDLRMFTW